MFLVQTLSYLLLQEYFVNDYNLWLNFILKTKRFYYKVKICLGLRLHYTWSKEAPMFPYSLQWRTNIEYMKLIRNELFSLYQCHINFWWIWLSLCFYTVHFFWETFFYSYRTISFTHNFNCVFYSLKNWWFVDVEKWNAEQKCLNGLGRRKIFLKTKHFV